MFRNYIEIGFKVILRFSTIFKRKNFFLTNVIATPCYIVQFALFCKFLKRTLGLQHIWQYAVNICNWSIDCYLTKKPECISALVNFDLCIVALKKCFSENAQFFKSFSKLLT